MKRVLVVDDAMFMRKMLGGILEKFDCKVVGEASNGREAVELYPKLKPDLVTLDITMPDMSGLEAIQEIRKIDPNATVIMCSAMGQQSMVIDAIQYGAKDFIVKPFNEERIKDALLRLQ